MLFVHRLREHGAQDAIVTEAGQRISYADLAGRVEALAASLESPARLVIIEFANHPDCIVAYLACLAARHPVILVEPGSTALDERISKNYAASLVFRLAGGEWRFETLGMAEPAALHPELCILLSTSGTTGSPKLVRLSRTNIQSNAESIASYLGICAHDRAVTTLPLHYSFGMSVLNSHLHAGAAVLLTERSVVDQEFWTFVRQENTTSLSGVPFTFDLLERADFRSQHYPSLRYLAQAGGKLSAERVTLYAQWALESGKQFFVMYGQTEASPRMAYVPPDELIHNTECIGVPIPGGTFELIGEDGAPVAGADQPGELQYRGPNVMMGYAESADDLARPAGPDTLMTGDLACRKENGNYYITGRKSRFSKIHGLRISLDEIERWLHGRGWQGIASGDDKLIVVAVTSVGEEAELKRELLQRFSLPPSAVHIIFLAQLPTLSSTKFDYRAVLRLGREARDQVGPGSASLIDGYREILGRDDVRPDDSFLDLGGDSVNLVEISLLLESHLGFVPENWEARSIAALEAVKEAAALPAGAPGPAAARPGRLRRHGFWVACATTVGLLIAGEAVLQARSYLSTGRSALNLATGKSKVMHNDAFGVRTYRPNMQDENPADDREFVTNSLGFRSPEIAPVPAPGEVRIVVVGASTVAGAYAKTNSTTFPSFLEQQLRGKLGNRTVNVINAGIEGYTVRDIDLLVERGILSLHPTMVIVYPGFNDMVAICKASARPTQSLEPLPAPALPRWVLSRELISKNTVPLRQAPVRAGIVDPEKYFPQAYGETLDRMVGKLDKAGIQTVLMTVARAYKAGDGEEAKRLATTALFYNYCLDYDGLHKAGNMFNQAIARVAERHGATLVDFAEKMPSGPKYFVDAAHFTRLGEQQAAEIIYKDIADHPSLATQPERNARK